MCCEVSSIKGVPDPSCRVVGEVGQGWRTVASSNWYRGSPEAKANECVSSDRDVQIIDLSWINDPIVSEYPESFSHERHISPPKE